MIIFDTVYEQMATAPGFGTAIRALAPVLAEHGCGAVKFPPTRNTKNPFSLGYDPATDLDFGQWEALHITGTAQDLLSTINACHAAGMLAIEDCVNRQYKGPAPMYERDADGKINPQLFPKFATCFVPNAKRDVPFKPDNGADDGILVSYQGTSGYMLKGKVQSMRFAESVLGWDLFRLDEAGGLSVETSRAFQAARPGANYAEVYDGDPAVLARFVREVGMCVLDFTQHFAFRAVSQGASLQVLVGNGFAFRDPDNAYVYIESNDTDGPDGIVNNKLWFYERGLTVPARGCLIYAGDFQRYELGPRILQRMKIATALAIGKFTEEYESDTLLCWSRDGDGGQYGWSGGLFCGINSDPINTRKEWVHTPFGPNVHLKDFLGNGPDVWTNQDGWGYFTFGPNSYGSAQNGVMYSRAGFDLDSYTIPRPPTGLQGTGDFFNFSKITVQP